MTGVEKELNYATEKYNISKTERDIRVIKERFRSQYYRFQKNYYKIYDIERISKMRPVDQHVPI